MNIHEHFDLITLGRVGMDLFSEQLGAPFEQIESFSASVGGSPTNIAIGGSRLGLKTAVLTGVGQDKVGAFVRAYLEKEGVGTRFVFTKAEGRTGLAVVGVEPPGSFPLTFYREHPADVLIGMDDVLTVPFERVKSLLISGTALAKGPCRDATFFAAEKAKAAGVSIFIDLDLRPDQWHDPRAYGVNVRAVLPHVDVVIGTEEESYAALLDNPNEATSSSISDLNEKQREALGAYLPRFLEHRDHSATWILKRGPNGVRIYDGQAQPADVPGFNVEVLNTVGAGDAFASGLIYGYVQDWSWEKSAHFANACGAIVVSRHGCSSAMPYFNEVEALIRG